MRSTEAHEVRPPRAARDDPPWRAGRPGFLDWGAQVEGPSKTDRAVLLHLAVLVDEAGRWQVTMAELARVAGVCRNTLRASLDRLAMQRLVMFKAEAYRGRAQGAHDFLLVRTDEERRVATAAGYGFDRRIMDRTPEQPMLPGVAVAETLQYAPEPSENRPENTVGGGQKLTEGRSTRCPRVGQTVDRRSTTPKTYTKLVSPHPPANGGRAGSDPIDEEMPGGPATCPPSTNGSGGPTRSPSPSFDDLWGAYPLRPGMSREKARRQWAAMPDEMQREAFGYVATVLASAYADPTSRPRHLCNFLRDRDWIGHLEPARPPPDVAIPVRVDRDTPEGRLWMDHERRAGRPAPKWYLKHGPNGPGSYFPARWPPGYEPARPRPRNNRLAALLEIVAEDASCADVSLVQLAPLPPGGSA